MLEFTRQKYRCPVNKRVFHEPPSANVIGRNCSIAITIIATFDTIKILCLPMHSTKF